MRKISFALAAVLFASVLAFASHVALAQTTCGFGAYNSTSGMCVGYLTSGTSWTVPSDWNSSNNTIEAIGGGGGGGGDDSANAINGGGGGGGGAYSKSVNVNLTVGASVSYAVGTGGASGTYTANGGAGGDTYLCNSTANCASISGTAVVVGAKGGGGGTYGGVGTAGGAGGSSASGKASGTGSAMYSGGAGGSGDTNDDSGGGGGAGGMHGSGNSGGSGTGANGGAGGSGDAGYGGAGGTASNNSTSAQSGGSGTEWSSSPTYGSGGGGGGEGYNFRSNGSPNGGTYGGGGGGGVYDSTNYYDNPGGAGYQGIIVISYAPSSSTPPPSCTVSVNPTSVSSGSSSTLSWSSSNATDFYISNVGYVTADQSSSASVTPSTTTTYSGAAGNGTATSTCSATLTVTTSVSAPSVTTGSASSITSSSATLGGSISATGGANATQSGIAYSTDPALATGVSTTTLGSQTGTASFSSAVSSLSAGTVYYYRAYATNSAGTGYGSILSFTTTSAPAPTAGWTDQTGAGSRLWQAITSSSNGMDLAAALNPGNIYTSTDGGVTWTAQTGAGSRYWTTITSSSDGTHLAAAIGGGSNTGYIYTSTDGGVTWTAQTGSGARDWWSITSSSDGSHLAAAAYGNYIYTSTDGGATWTAQTSAGTANWYAITSSSDGSHLAAAQYPGYIYTSTDGGATWTEHTSVGSQNWYSITSSSDGSHLAAAAEGGDIYTSTDGGTTWTAQTGAGSRSWWSITSSSDGSRLAAVVYTGNVYLSTDGGVTWTAQLTNLGNQNWRGITTSSDGSRLAAVIYGGDIYTYYASLPPTVTTGSASLVTSYSSTLNGNYSSSASVSQYGFALSTDPTLVTGVSTSTLGSGPTGSYNFSDTSLTSSLAAGTTYYYRAYAVNTQGTGYGSIASFTTTASSGGSITITTGSAGSITTNSATMNASYSMSSFSGTAVLGVVYSTDPTLATGASSSTINTINTNGSSGSGGYSLPATGLNPATTYYYRGYSTNGSGSVESYGSILSFTTTSSTCTTTVAAATGTWTAGPGTGGKSWYAVTSSADGSHLAAAIYGGDIYTSADGGATWTNQTAAGSRNWYGITSSSDGSVIAAVVYGGDIYLSTNGGVTWTALTSAPQNKDWVAITSSANGSVLAAAIHYPCSSGACPSGNDIYTSTNEGGTWTNQTAAGSRAWAAITSSADGTHLAAAVNGSGLNQNQPYPDSDVFTSTDGGVTWTDQTGVGSGYWSAITSSSDGSIIAVAGLNGVISVSKDGGVTWTVGNTGTNSYYWRGITSSSNGTRLAAADEFYGTIMTSSDGGMTWTVSTSSPASFWYAIASSADGSKLVAAYGPGQYVYTYYEPAPTCSVNSDSATINAGQSVNLCWASAYTNSFSISSIGNVTPNQYGSTSTTPSQTTTYYGSATGPGGSGQCGTTVTVNQPQLSISAATSSVPYDGTTTVTWSATNVQSCTLSGGGLNNMPVNCSDSTTTPPLTSNTTYTLTAQEYNGAGSTSDPTTITISPAACMVSFSQNPITQGSGATLSWSASNATAFYINNAGYMALSNGAGSGSFWVQPSQTTDYSGAAGNGSATSTCPASLTVSCTPAYSCANSSTIDYTDPSCNTTTYATCSSPSFCSSGSSTCLYPSPSYIQNGTYTGHLFVAPSIVQQNATTSLYWDVGNVSTCTVSGTDGESWSGAAAGCSSNTCASPANGETTSPIQQQTVFTLQCTGLDGSNVNESQTVNIVPIFRER